MNVHNVCPRGMEAVFRQETTVVLKEETHLKYTQTHSGLGSHCDK